MIIAIIPARGGSKRIPRKNIRNFCGKPMIAWSIAAARDCGFFDHVIVSTDDREIASIAGDYGAEVPFIRPAKLANDYSTTAEVIAHSVHWMKNRQWQTSAICCLYPTAPLISSEDIEAGLAVLKSGQWDYTFAATEYAAPIFRSFHNHPKRGIEMFFPEHFNTRSQDLPAALHDAGQFYWGKPEAWLTQKRLFDHHSHAIIIPRWRVQDIDTEEDWTRAEIIMEVLSRTTKRS